MKNLSFTSYNVKGLQVISKRIKVFEYLKITSLQIVSFFFKKNTLPLKMRSYGMMNSKDSYFKSNSCGVAIGFVGTKALNILNLKCDNLGRILVIVVNIDDSVFILTNIYNANTESE